MGGISGNLASSSGKTRGLLTQKVNPRGTSISCFNCGYRVEKNLADRVHHCPNCGIKIDRDWNSGINILNRALMAVGLPLNGCGKSAQDVEDQQISFVNLRSPHQIRDYDVGVVTKQGKFPTPNDSLK